MKKVLGFLVIVLLMSTIVGPLCCIGVQHMFQTIVSDDNAKDLTWFFGVIYYIVLIIGIVWYAKGDHFEG